jgi:hypothetical protein
VIAALPVDPAGEFPLLAATELADVLGANTQAFSQPLLPAFLGTPPMR